MRFFHTKCGHELETFTVKADCPIPDVGVVGEIPSPIGWTKAQSVSACLLSQMQTRSIGW